MVRSANQHWSVVFRSANQRWSVVVRSANQRWYVVVRSANQRWSVVVRSANQRSIGVRSQTLAGPSNLDYDANNRSLAQPVGG
ncbi:MAG: hypothetical protein JNL67_20485 [Planctomycetaceae bacterium]|nr:hypothetical protein [Planctomycetaceae bacterium]